MRYASARRSFCNFIVCNVKYAHSISRIIPNINIAPYVLIGRVCWWCSRTRIEYHLLPREQHKIGAYVVQLCAIATETFHRISATDQLPIVHVEGMICCVDKSHLFWCCTHIEDVDIIVTCCSSSGYETGIFHGDQPAGVHQWCHNTQCDIPCVQARWVHICIGEIVEELFSCGGSHHCAVTQGSECCIV